MPTIDVRKVYSICGHCGGDGKMESTTQSPGQEPVTTTITCPYCNGLTVYLWGYVTEQVFSVTVPGS